MIQDDAAEPGGEPGIPPEFTDRPVGGEEGLLHHVASFVVVADHPEGDVEHLLLVPPDQNRERFGITPPAACDKTGVIVRDGPILRIHWIMVIRQGVTSSHCVWSRVVT
jgi:hypothetical protein